MDKLLKILTDNCPGVDFEHEKALVDDELIDSLDIVMLVGEINDAFDIEITAQDVMPENFNSAEAIYSLIQRLREQ